MCLIAYGEKEDILDLGLKKIWDSNPHGAGLIIPRKNPLVIKGIMSLASLEKTLQHISNRTELAIHFRFATHGAVNEKNTHPFKVGPISWLMHNGILNGLGKNGDKGYSDSAELAQILTHVRAIDREKLLDLLPGRFFYVSGRKVFMSGLTEYKKVMCSNTYWDTAYLGVRYNGSMNSWKGNDHSWNNEDCYINGDIAEINKLAKELAD